VANTNILFHAGRLLALEEGHMPFEIDADTLEALRAEGWFVYRFLDGSVRFMCSWATTAEAVDEIAAALRRIA
ncbi:MAG: carotenoid oxygenase family protein, partial [Phenylobacterium sp.]